MYKDALLCAMRLAAIPSCAASLLTLGAPESHAANAQNLVAGITGERTATRMRQLER